MNTSNLQLNQTGRYKWFVQRNMHFCWHKLPAIFIACYKFLPRGDNCIACSWAMTLPMLQGYHENIFIYFSYFILSSASMKGHETSYLKPQKGLNKKGLITSYIPYYLQDAVGSGHIFRCSKLAQHLLSSSNHAW